MSHRVLVLIRDLELLAHIGVHGHEKGKPQPVRINVWLTGEIDSSSDTLAHAIDYEAVVEKIRRLIAAGHVNLAETMAERIAAACFEDARVVHARVRVEKLHALPGAAAAGVEIERDAPK
ncbi:MAG TPA: dihydroneopterin aldolase [Micropepsaceae bacterium]|jgi:dihydroneopterin aldolase|nr:dihydroneopterin aldolase [Micropepsaceae bacterium]